MVMRGSGCGIPKGDSMPTPAYWTGLIRRRNVMVWSTDGFEYTVMVGMDLSCWMAHSTSKVSGTRGSKLGLCLTSKVMGCYFSSTTPSLSQFAVCTLPWPAYSPALYPHRAMGWDFTDREIMSRDPPPQTTLEQLCLAIQGVWDDTPHARITRLILAVPWKCKVVHEAQFLSHPLLTLLHLIVCCTEQNATIKHCLTNDDSQQNADSTHTIKFIQAVYILIKFPF